MKTHGLISARRFALSILSGTSWEVNAVAGRQDHLKLGCQCGNDRPLKSHFIPSFGTRGKVDLISLRLIRILAGNWSKRAMPCNEKVICIQVSAVRFNFSPTSPANSLCNPLFSWRRLAGFTSRNFPVDQHCLPGTKATCPCQFGRLRS
jgi:hypothetical protein